MSKIGFIGLGNMGSKMCIHLANAGHLVSGFDIDENLINNLSTQNIIKEMSIAEISQNKDIIFTMLPNGEIVESVLKEILNHTSNNPIIVDCSTIDVSSSKSLCKLSLTKNIDFLDAPVSGGTIGAANGTLTFMVGGDKERFNEIISLLNLMGSKNVYCGESGSGQATKLCNNMLLATTMIGVSESFNMAKKLNLDMETLFEVISTATGSCWAINNYCPIPNVGPKSPADNNFLPGFSAKLMSKDLKLAIQAADDTSSNISFGRMSEKIFTEMAIGENGNKDFSAIIEELNNN